MAKAAGDHLILRFLTESFPLGKVEWCIQERSGIKAGMEEESSSIHTFAGRNWGRVTVLVPGELVRMCLLTLSPEQRRHKEQIVPGLLEEELAEDIESVQIAAIDGDAPSQVRALAIQKDKLDDLLGVITKAGLSTDAILPDYWPLTYAAAGKTHLLDDENRWIGRFSNGEGFSSDPLLCAHLLARSLTHPEDTVLLHRANGLAAQSIRQMMDDHGLRHLALHEEQAPPEASVTAYLSRLLPRGKILPSLVPRPDVSRAFLWRRIAWILALVVLYFAVWLGEALYYQWKADDYAAQYNMTFKTLFPDTEIADDPSPHIAEVSGTLARTGPLQAAFLRESFRRIADARNAAVVNNISYSLRFEKISYEAETGELVLITHSLDPAMLKLFSQSLNLGENEQALYMNENYTVTRFTFREHEEQAP